MVVITFHTTAEAFAFEAACKEEALPGRLGTIPRCLSAGCGFAWQAGTEHRVALEALMRRRGLNVQGVHEL